MILMKYKDWSIYQLYNRKSDSVVISESIDFNKDLLTDENTENNEIINQSFIFFIKFFTEFFIKFFNKNNNKIFNSSNSMSESVKDKAETKKNAMKISSSWEKMSIMRHEKSKKKTTFVNRMILSVKILEWEELIKKSELLTLLFLAKQDLNLYINSDIWLRSARDLKVYCLSIMQQQEIDVNDIQISKTYQQAMKSSQKDEWIVTMKIKIHDIKRKKIYNLVKWFEKKSRSKFLIKNESTWSKSMRTMRFWNTKSAELFRVSVNKKKLIITKSMYQ